MPDSIPLLRASHMLPFFSALNSIEAPLARLLNQAGLAIEQFEKGDNLVAEEPCWHFIDIASQYTKKEDFGFWVTEHCLLDKYGTFGENLMVCETLFSALNTFINTMDKQSNCPTFWLQEEGDFLWFFRKGMSNVTKGQWPVEQHVVAFMIELVKMYLGKSWTPELVKLQSSVTHGCNKASCLIGSQLYVKQTFTGIAIPKGLLNEKRQMQNESLRLKQQQIIPDSNADKIRQLFEQHYFGHLPTIEEVSKCLVIQPRTLQRMLKKEGTDFRTLLEIDKYKRAKSFLLFSKISLTEISLELGFTNPANFTRAFKRWSEMTPQVYRNNFSPNK
jgi:AraC-like DNA-binding protein